MEIGCSFSRFRIHWIEGKERVVDIERELNVYGIALGVALCWWITHLRVVLSQLFEYAAATALEYNPRSFYIFHSYLAMSLL